MRIIVASDSHGKVSPLERIIENMKPDVFIFCGDGTADVENLEYIYTDVQFHYVKGNCDFGNYPISKEIKVGSKRIYFAHGHTYSVKNDDFEIFSEAKRRGVDILLYGHTHNPFVETRNGIVVMNPGSVARPNFGAPTFGVIDFVGKNMLADIRELKNNSL